MPGLGAVISSKQAKVALCPTERVGSEASGGDDVLAFMTLRNRLTKGGGQTGCVIEVYRDGRFVSQSGIGSSEKLVDSGDDEWMSFFDHIVTGVVEDMDLRRRKMVLQAIQAFHSKTPVAFSPDDLHGVVA